MSKQDKIVVRCTQRRRGKRQAATVKKTPFIHNTNFGGKSIKLTMRKLQRRNLTEIEFKFNCLKLNEKLNKR